MVHIQKSHQWDSDNADLMVNICNYICCSSCSLFLRKGGALVFVCTSVEWPHQGPLFIVPLTSSCVTWSCISNCILPFFRGEKNTTSPSGWTVFMKLTVHLTHLFGFLLSLVSTVVLCYSMYAYLHFAFICKFSHETRTASSGSAQGRTYRLHKAFLPVLLPRRRACFWGWGTRLYTGWSKSLTGQWGVTSCPPPPHTLPASLSLQAIGPEMSWEVDMVGMLSACVFCWR